MAGRRRRGLARPDRRARAGPGMPLCNRLAKSNRLPKWHVRRGRFPSPSANLPASPSTKATYISLSAMARVLLNVAYHAHGLPKAATGDVVASCLKKTRSWLAGQIAWREQVADRPRLGDPHPSEQVIHSPGAIELRSARAPCPRFENFNGRNHTWRNRWSLMTKRVRRWPLACPSWPAQCGAPSGRAAAMQSWTRAGVRPR